MKRVGQIFRETLVDRIKSDANANSSLFLLSYSQVSGNKIGEFRKKLKTLGASVYVSKNAIAQIALKDLEYADLAKKVTGQTAIVCGDADASEVAKALIDFEKECESVNIQGGALEGRMLDVLDVKKLSELPSREVLLSMLLSTIQAPLTRLAGALNAKSRDVLSILKQLSEKKGGE